MGSDDSSYNFDNMGERRDKIVSSVSDHLIGSSKPGSIVVDMERVSHLLDKDAINSNLRIVRNLSRKGSIRVNGETKFGGNERDATTSPRASSTITTTLHGGGGGGICTPEKVSSVGVMAVGPTDHHHHHQITITTSSAGGGGGGGGPPTESKWAAAKRLSFRRTHLTWTLDPRRILFFFATLSSMGTILLIYFTLSMGKLNANDNASI